MSNQQQLAGTVRAVCIKAALEAYEEGGVLGLCAEGPLGIRDFCAATTGFRDSHQAVSIVAAKSPLTLP